MKCRGCGIESDAKPFRVVGCGVDLEGMLCGPCMTTALEGAERMRVDFEALLADGFDRLAANDVMIKRIRSGRY